MATGFDWRSLVDQLAQVERAPERRMYTEQNSLRQRNASYASLQTQLTSLKTRVDALKDPVLFTSRAATVGDSTMASATADAGTALGKYTFSFSQLATAVEMFQIADLQSALSRQPIPVGHQEGRGGRA